MNPSNLSGFTIPRNRSQKSSESSSQPRQEQQRPYGDGLSVPRRSGGGPDGGGGGSFNQGPRHGSGNQMRGASNLHIPRHGHPDRYPDTRAPLHPGHHHNDRHRDIPFHGDRGPYDRQGRPFIQENGHLERDRYRDQNAQDQGHHERYRESSSQDHGHHDRYRDHNSHQRRVSVPKHEHRDSFRRQGSFSRSSSYDGSLKQNSNRNVHSPTGSVSPPRPRTPRTFDVKVESETPFVLKVSSANGQPLEFAKPNPALEATSSVPRKKRKVKEEGEMEDTDMNEELEQKVTSVDTFFPAVGESKSNKRRSTSTSKKLSASSDSDEQPQTKKARGGRLKRLKKSSLNDESEDEDLQDLLAPVEDETPEAADPNAIDAPPPGELSSLWYSREQFLHVWSIEKILAWKTRIKPLPPKTTLELETALKLHEAALNATRDDHIQRMDISRINAMNCPVVLSIAKEMFEEEQSSEPEHPHIREEIYLIKWRGRSYRHCSWERYADLVKYDPSNNNAAKGKINRFVALQEAALGKNWKKILEDSRKDIVSDQEDRVNLVTEEEEYFSPDFIEVERIVGCDEGEIDMKVFAKQRTLNLKAAKAEEQDLEKSEDAETKRLADKTKSKLFAAAKKVKSSLNKEKDEDWDPEDYVQYAVKWKALPLAEITFEYWKDLKSDCVELAEDFWHRQKAPPDDEITSKPHPEIQQFQKLKESPVYGVSSTPRPIYDFGDGFKENAEIEDDSTKALHLRSYQLEGVNWLMWNWFNKRSCILADEMGLGKTIQTVSFLRQLCTFEATKVRGPFLIVAPLSLIQQWQSEASVWTPDFNAIVYHGSAAARAYLVNHEFYFCEPFVNKAKAQKLKKSNVTKFNIMITTYEVVMKDIEVFSQIRWRAVVVDEAHRLKNNKSRLFGDLAAVPRDFCLLLTGTPLQNSTEELWALLNFADPVAFKSRDSFIEKFGQLSDAKQVSDLHDVLKPYLLRRVKEDVAKSLPPKEETILEVSLTPIQKTFYKAIYERNTSFLFKGAKPSNSPSLMNIMMELRKCCNHPFLIRGAEEKIVGEAAAAAIAAAEAVGKKADDVNMTQLTAEQLVNSSGKMVLLAKLLPKLYDGGHKVLIFSQMVRTLDILNDFLRIKQYSFERLDGSTTAAARNSAVNRFNKKSLNRFIMLLSTRAGGLGLNLTAADTVIIFDSDWNPQNDLQAMARAHRIGQTQAVSVYRLLTAKTYEMHMFHSASMKLGLDRAMLAQQRQTEADELEADPEKISKSTRAMEREKQAREIDELLKKGAYDVFRDEDDKEAKEFMETDIDKLLERSTKTVSYGSTTSNMSSGLGSFSKASFVATTGEGEDKDIDLDDPDFWKKAIGLEAPALEMDDETAALVEAYADKKRVRKQIVNYGADPYTEYMEAERKEKEKLKQKAKLEKEEKERLKLEKKKQKEESEKDKKKVDKPAKPTAVSSSSLNPSPDKKSKSTSTLVESSTKVVKAVKVERPAAENSKVARFEHIKYAWEQQHRDAVVDAILRFGFGRFCKIRQESNMPGLPMQDLELFSRYYLYQLGVQAGVSLMAQFKQDNATNEATEGAPSPLDCCSSLAAVLKPISRGGAYESKWILDAISTSLAMHDEVCSNLRELRMIPILTDTAFVSKLRKGEALRSLRRLASLTRLNSIMAIVVDGVIKDLGPEELGKRGSATKNRGELEIEVKTKLITVEELSHAMAEIYPPSVEKLPVPVPWWDRSCDIALVLGSFLFGLGSYESMSIDEQLPFAWKLKSYAHAESDAVHAICLFNDAVNAVSQLVNRVTHQKTDKSKTNLPIAVVVKESVGNVEKIDATIKEKQSQEASEPAVDLKLSDCYKLVLEKMRTSKRLDDFDGKERCLPMPDGRILDGRILQLLEEMELYLRLGRRVFKRKKQIPAFDTDLWVDNIADLHPSMCSTSSRFLTTFPSCSHPDSSHYLQGPCSAELEAFAFSANSKKTCSNTGVPRVFTRFSIAGLIYSLPNVVDKVVAIESTGDSSRSVYDIPQPLLDSDFHRRKISVALLNVGSPLLPSDKFKVVDDSVVALLGKQLHEESPPASFLTLDRIKSEWSDIPLRTKEVMSYIDHVLLPHCLRLCLNGNGTAARVFQKLPNIAKKKKDSAPTSILTELKLNEGAIKTSYDRLFPVSLATIPDPMVALNLHSDEAIARALAILRRFRLMKSIRYIVGGGVSPMALLKFLKGPVMRQNLSELPIWWCPWIHDLAVLINASTCGLFALFGEGTPRVHPALERIFSQEGIRQHIRTLFESGRAMPQSYQSQARGNHDMESWIEDQAREFPTPQVCEQRLASICFALTKGHEEEVLYDHVPMWDHGAWPASGNKRTSRVAGGVKYGQDVHGVELTSSLLKVVEDVNKSGVEVRSMVKAAYSYD